MKQPGAAALRARYIMQSRRGEPEAAAHRLDRPLPGAFPRSRTRRSRRPCARSTTWSARARCARSAARTSPRQQVDAAQAAAHAHKLAAFVTCQDEYSLLVRDIEGDLHPGDAAARHEPPALFPLASGFLTGKYKRGAPLPKDARLAYSSHHAASSSTTATGRWSRSCDDCCGEVRPFACSSWRSAGCWQADDGERDRRRHQARADRAERARRRAAALRRAMLAELDRITVMTKRALIIGGSVGGLFAANLLRDVGWDATVFERNPEELAGRGAGIATHPQLARRDAAARHPVRRFDGDQRRQGRVHRPRRQGLRRARHRAGDELVGPHLPLAARPRASRELSPRHVARRASSRTPMASPRSSPTARASAATC